LQADYVEAARARGIPELQILWAHALKNALIPVITVLGLTFAALLGAAFFHFLQINGPQQLAWIVQSPFRSELQHSRWSPLVTHLPPLHISDAQL
jgi:ABC-type dipeptide/oligopeptide/nickel transport systems, permease components